MSAQEMLSAAEAAARYGIPSADAARGRLRRARKDGLVTGKPTVRELPGGGAEHLWPEETWAAVADRRQPKPGGPRRAAGRPDTEETA